MAITSQVGGPLKFGEFLIRDWQSAGLLKRSGVKAAITTIEAKLVRRQLGRLSDYDLELLNSSLASFSVYEPDSQAPGGDERPSAAAPT